MSFTNMSSTVDNNVKGIQSVSIKNYIIDENDPFSE